MLPPTVSVVIPCFNQGHFLAEAIDSVSAQSFAATELVIVDDGSTDSTAAVAKRYPAARYLVQPNLGLARARNRGLRAARCEFLVFLDADDRLRPGALEAGVHSLEAHPRAALTYGRCQRIDEKGRPIPTALPVPMGRDPYASLLRQNPIWTPAAAMFRRAACGQTLRFDPAVDASADYELYLCLARCCEIREHPAIVAEYRQHPGNMSRDAAMMLRSTLLVLKAQRQHLDTPERVRAFREGGRAWRALYGEQVVERVRMDWRHPPRWPHLASSIALLLRHYPAGVAAHARRKLLRVLDGGHDGGKPGTVEAGATRMRPGTWAGVERSSRRDEPRRQAR
jgi:glycosyltransferase involved in cell wall biosynthesis